MDTANEGLARICRQRIDPWYKGEAVVVAFAGGRGLAGVTPRPALVAFARLALLRMGLAGDLGRSGEAQSRRGRRETCND